jgi:hypothetical protein
MDKKIVGYTLTIVGVALIVVGALNIAGVLSLQIIDTTPPEILYTFPRDQMTYRLEDVNEIIVYARDSSGISSVTYTDKYGTKTLSLTPYTKLLHPLIIEGKKFPDVNFDGYVNSLDVNLVSLLDGVYKDDPRYNPVYDINSDGKIDIKDVGIVSRYCITGTFYIPMLSPPYSREDSVQFTITVIDSMGNTQSFAGTFKITDKFQPLSGVWKVNDKQVSDNMLIEVEEEQAKQVIVSFTCNDTSVSAQDVTAKVYNNGGTYYLTYAGNNTWSTTIKLPAGKTTFIFEASAATVEYPKIDKIAVIFSTPEKPIFTIGHALIVSGVILCIAGVIVLTKKEEAW